jgi:putative hydrolase of the HAD superfamily
MRGVTTIVFDLDNTLIDRDRAVAAWLATVLTPSHVSSCLRLDAGGYGDRSAFFAAVAEASACSQKEIRERFRAELPHHIYPTVGATELLAQLQFSHRLAIASNGSTHLQNAKLTAARLGVDFALVAISEAFGVAKPAEAFFTRMLEKLSCPAECALMVGDHPINDIAGAAQVGMRTCWLRTKHFTAPAMADRCVDSLAQVPCL